MAFAALDNRDLVVAHSRLRDMAGIEKIRRVPLPDFQFASRALICSTPDRGLVRTGFLNCVSCGSRMAMLP